MKTTSIKKFKNVWFTSDTHFDDERLDLFTREVLFESATEVDNFIIKQWNDNVKDGDLVIDVGDVALTQKGLDKVKGLNGTKWLVKGNYDTSDGTAKFKMSDDILLEQFDKVFDDLTIEIDGEEVFINHFPTSADVDKFNIVGHIHGTWKVQRNMINVGVDAWHFTPVPLKTIKFQMNGIRKYYDQNVYAGELKANLNFKHGEFKVLRAPIYDTVEHEDDINIFLAGPIQGAQEWQEEIISKIEKEFKDKHFTCNIIISSPRRLEKPKNFIYEEQVEWETYYLNRSYMGGITVFWLPTQDNEQQYDNKSRSYAQTSRFELGEWFGRGLGDFVIGVQSGFHGEKYITYKFKKDYEYDVETNINNVVKSIIKKINELI